MLAPTADEEGWRAEHLITAVRSHKTRSAELTMMFEMFEIMVVGCE